MKKVFVFFIGFILFLLIINNVSAWFPNTHSYIIDKVKENEEIKNSYLEICFDNAENERAFRAGAILPDITAVNYFNEKYRKTHDWNFQKDILANAVSQDEKCLAYGVAFHLISDSIAHEKLIPLKIEKSKLPGWLTHSLIEERYDAYLIQKNSNLIDESKKSLDAFYSFKGEKYIEDIQDALGIDLNVKSKINQLNFIIRTLNGFIIMNEPTRNFMNLFWENCNSEEINDYMQKSINLIMNSKITNN